MGEYTTTQENYDKGFLWHAQKSLTYNWSEQIELFCRNLPGKKILDAGCGSGRDTAEFLKQGFQVEGIDFSEKTITQCKKQFPKAKFHTCNMQKTAFQESFFDGIWSCASILNLKKADVTKTLSEFKRILKKEGHLFISVKEGDGEQMIPDQIGKRFFSFYSVNEISTAVKEAGFDIYYTETVLDSKLTEVNSEQLKPAWICIYAKKNS